MYRSEDGLTICSDPRVSVVIPTYDSEREALARSINSVLGQDASSLELIVVDDGSRKPFSGMQGEFPMIRWVALGDNRGVAAARNAGAASARGELLAFLDAGDWWEPDKLSRQLALYEANPRLGLVYSGVYVHRGESVMEYPAQPPLNCYRELMVRQCVTGSASSVLIPRRVFHGVGGFHEAEDIPEDRDLWLRLAKEHAFDAVDDPLVHIAVSADSRSGDPARKEETYRRFLERHESEIRDAGLWGRARCHYHLVIGQKYLQHRQWFRGFSFMIKAIQSSPMHVAKKVIQRILGL